MSKLKQNFFIWTAGIILLAFISTGHFERGLRSIIPVTITSSTMVDFDHYVASIEIGQ